MGVFHHEDPPNPSKKCKFLASTLKDVFSNCSTCGGRLSTADPKEDSATSDVDDDQEVVVSLIRSGAMEKLKHKPFILTDSFSWVFSPKTGELFLTSKGVQQDGNDKDSEGNNERDEFFSVASCFSCCSSALSREAFYSVKTNFSNLSRCSSFNGFEFQDYDLRRRSIIQEFRHCEGWPFGLYKKALLLPPLPKSPSDSWTWRKGSRTLKMVQA